jgi:ribosomal protein S6
MQVQLDPESIGELERNLKLTEEVIRYLLVRAED